MHKGNIRVIVGGDAHCGNLVGLTPPGWQRVLGAKVRKAQATGQPGHKYEKVARLSRMLWKEYTRLLDSLAPYQVVLWTGDMVDGKGQRSGGTELLTSDRTEQVDMAVAVSQEAKARSGVPNLKEEGVFGTGYHVGTDEDWEAIVAREAGWSRIGSHNWPMVNGCIFDLKHKIGTSGVPHGRGTAMLRDILWNEMWAARELQPRARVVLRGHAHYYIGLDMDDVSGFICPALQGFGSKFGSRECSGLVHWGLMHFDIDPHGNIVDWDKHLIRIALHEAKAHDIMEDN